MPDSQSDKSGWIEVDGIHRNDGVSVFLAIRMVRDAATFPASTVVADLPVP